MGRALERDEACPMLKNTGIEALKSLSVKSSKNSSTIRTLLVAALGCVGVLALDAALFRTNFYLSELDPDSSTGLFEMILRRELRAQLDGGPNLVVTLGNSRLAYSQKYLDQHGLNEPYPLRNAGMAGSNARVWYYMLRELDPTRRRYKAIVLALDDFDDEERAGNPNNDIRELHYVIGRLRLSDVWSFGQSFDDPQLQFQALRGGILRGLVLQEDIRALLANPVKRYKYVELCKQGWVGWDYDYLETERSMEGLAIDYSTLQVTFPPGADDDQRGTVKSFLAHEQDPQMGWVEAYHRKWLGGVIDLYRGSPTKIILLKLPRGPIPRPENLSPRREGPTRELARRRNVLMANEHAFDALEHPEFFRDGMHLNREGINRFSVMLEQEVSRLLGSPEDHAF
jgi:hypothetical protein